MNSTDAFQIGPWLVEPSTRRIIRDDEIHSLEPLPMRVLMLLVERQGEVVSASEITEKIWGVNHIGESQVAHAIGQIRKLLIDDPRNPQYIETIPKTGYRLIAKVTRTLKSVHSKKKYVSIFAVTVVVAFGLLWFATSSQNSLRSVEKKVRLLSPILVIFPLTNRTGNANNDHLIRTMTEELNRAMEQLDEISIINSYSTNEFLRQNVSNSDVYKVLGASHMLSGTLHGSDDNLQVSVRLVNNVEGIEFFTQVFKLEQSDVLSSQIGIALEVTNRVSECLGVPGLDVVSPLYVKSDGANKETNLNAQTSYIKGQIALSLSTREGYFLAEEHFENAVKLDPDFALAWIALTRSRSILLSTSYLPRDTAYRRALEASDQAIKTAPHMAAAWAQGCRLRLTEMQDKAGSKPYCQRAFELDPDADGVSQAATQAALIEGDLDAAIKSARRRVGLDPLRPGAHSFLGLLLFFANELDLAVESTEHALALNPNEKMTYGLLGHIALAKGNSKLAVEYFYKESVPVYRVQGLAIAYFESGQHGQSETFLDELKRDHSNDAAFQIAEVYGHRGDAEATFDWLAQSIERHDGGLVFISVSPYLKFVDADSRYQDLRSQAFQ